ncbi:MAG: serine/threonine-protein kinase [Polyangiaceae bacterium]
MQIEEGTLIADKYRLVERLARGGMGSVWTAHHEKLDAEVAIKFMDPELAASDDMHARFEREAKAAAKLRSPHVVQVLDYGVEQGQPFIVMERLHGEDLRTRLRQRQRLGLREGASILNQVCKALRVAAEHGIVHRDLKPANVFIAKSGDDEVVKVLDFGVAKALRPTADGEGTTSGILLGSPHYMSPEQARGLELDPRSDLFSLAVILYTAITGHKPFKGRDIGDIIVKICTEDVPPPSSLLPGLPQEVDQFFARALERDRAHRYQSARAMAADFAAIALRHDPPPQGLGRPALPSDPGYLGVEPTPSRIDKLLATPALPLELELPTDLDVTKDLATEPDVTQPSPGHGSERAPVSVGPASDRPGTLTLANTATAQRPPPRRRWPLALAGALLALAVAVAVLAARGPADTSAATTAAPLEGADPPRGAAPSATLAATVEAPPSASPSAEPTASVASAAASSSAPVVAPPVAPPRPAPKPAPPPPTPTGDDKHPVLGI